MTDTNNTAETAQAWDAITADAKGIVALQIGRTGEKAKYQGQTVTLDLSKLPADAIAFALHYGLKQYIADGTAGSEDQAGYDLGIRLRVEKLKTADFRRAAGERGPRVQTPEGLAKKMAADAIRAKLAAAGQKADAKVINEAAAKQVEANPAWIKKAEKLLEEQRKMAEALTLDGLDDILGLVEPEGDEG